MTCSPIILFNNACFRRHGMLTPVNPDRQAQTSVASTGRRAVLAALVLGLQTSSSYNSWATARQPVSAELLKAFEEAFKSNTDDAWSRAISISPNNSAAWSNRGTLRLQQGAWRAAYSDLLQALHLEMEQQQSVSALLLNNLGNAEGALGKWQEAMEHYQAAAIATSDDGISSIALANYALAAFELGDDDLAIKSARQLLRRDSNFLDMRAALTAFLWANGQRAAAEDSWEQLQQASDGLGAALYSRSAAVERVRHRWPPRATAALSAFITLSSCGYAEGYDLERHQYLFSAAASSAELTSCGLTPAAGNQ